MSDLRILRADVADALLVTTLTRMAYDPVYLAAVGHTALKSDEDYGPWLAGGMVWLARTAGTVVGLMVLDESAKDHLIVYSIAVHPDHQRKGIGGRLLDHAAERATALGRPELRLITNAAIPANTRFYARHGFTEIDRQPHYKPELRRETLIHMIRRS